MNRVFPKPLLVSNSPNCFIAAFETLLRNCYQHSSLIANRHMGFFYTNGKPDDYKSVFVACSSVLDVLQSVHEVERSSFEVNIDDDRERAKNQLIELLRNHIPVIIFVDTFFLKFFPKEKGHTLHALLASKLDMDNNQIFTSCSLPHQGMIDMDDLLLARNSRIHSHWVRNAWVQCKGFNSNLSVSEDYVMSAIEANLKAMRGNDERDLQQGLYGMGALRKFREDMVLWKDSLDRKDFNSLLRNIFAQLIFVCDERKRYANFLTEISHFVRQDISEIILSYKKIAYHWDIFRNLCFKRSLSSNIDVDRLLNRLDTLIEKEEKGLESLELLKESMGRADQIKKPDATATK